MNTLSTRLPATLLHFSLPSTTTTTTTAAAACNLFAASSSTPYSTTTSTITATIPTVDPIIVPKPITPSPKKTKTTTRKPKVSKVISQGLLKENWLNSLSLPSPTCSERKTTEESNWVIGVDPDNSGALALLKPEGSVEVFDSPHLKVPVGNKERNRLDPKSILQLIHSLDAPSGTTAYVEQSLPFGKDGKLGWWNGGFGYGLWIGILLASGISVVPVPSFVWKKELNLSGGSSKDDSRELASTLFPSISSMLKRKKDHGRAEALLIAAYGKGMRVPSEPSCTVENIVP